MTNDANWKEIGRLEDENADLEARLALSQTDRGSLFARLCETETRLADSRRECNAFKARLAEADEKLRRIRRMAELSAAMMRDPERTSGWVGSERVARGFERIAERASVSADDVR